MRQEHSAMNIDKKVPEGGILFENSFYDNSL